MPKLSYPGRVHRGMKANLCTSCHGGLAYGIPKTFDPRCEGCQAKLARYRARQTCSCKQDPECSKCADDRMLGLRDGTEPSPKQFSIGNWKFRNMTAEQRKRSEERLLKEGPAGRAAR